MSEISLFTIEQTKRRTIPKMRLLAKNAYELGQHEAAKSLAESANILEKKIEALEQTFKTAP